MKVYGIPNCDTVKKARDWFKANDIPYKFHDFKKEGISAEKLEEWSAKAGYEKVINKASSTYKALDASAKENLAGDKPLLSILQKNTSIIKRPVIEDGGFLYFGFDEETYRQHFEK